MPSATGDRTPHSHPSRVAANDEDGRRDEHEDRRLAKAHHAARNLAHGGARVERVEARVHGAIEPIAALRALTMQTDDPADLRPREGLGAPRQERARSARTAARTPSG
jgi:hypothetical protein